MIKPESLWCLLQDCADSKWLGDICRALGGQEVELDFGQQQALKIIRRDSELMDERMEVQREKERERNRKIAPVWRSNSPQKPTRELLRLGALGRDRQGIFVRNVVQRRNFGTILPHERRVCRVPRRKRRTQR